MRDHSSHIEVSRDEAIKLLLGSFEPAPERETVKLDVAAGRIAAQDVFSDIDAPNCRSCKMDSVAVHWDDFKNGMPDTSNWERGKQWQFANTGIGMPEGFDTAIVIEHVQVADDDSIISFSAVPSEQYAGTSEAGSRMKKGQLLVKAGEKLTPLLVSLVASGNHDRIEVLKKPVVAFIPTGNELVKPGGEVPLAKNVETNSLLAKGKVEEWGGVCKVWDIVPDNRELIKKAVVEAAREADIVVLNAGSSKGSDDWNVEMLEEVGTVLYHQTNHGPGHHSSGAVVDGTPVVGISGPPGGASFTMDFYLHPAVMHFLGQDTAMRTVRVRVDGEFAKRKHKPKVDPSIGGGENRPSIVAPDQDFYMINQMTIRQEDGGTGLVAIPPASAHLSPAEANACNGYYLLNRRKSPTKGDIIEVEVRP